MTKPRQWEKGWECPHCHLKRGADGYDPCLGKLSGILAACCGHGGHGFEHGYLYFENGSVLRVAILAIENGDWEYGSGIRRVMPSPAEQKKTWKKKINR